ncbi:patatin-like phospholipase family protein [Pararhodobacter sp. SW119]|uniref:patatin-like phospholipase family protein n=1 Tax=Pararhodobacter sp. SW119 TaxID=2780075 RepID=UPI001AE0D123|nr:patatin-like phospholipase family protein [Pararhodobacter sp. SW119]
MRSAAILALTGGGILARFTTRVLEDLQAQRDEMAGAASAQAPMAEAFDLLAGTSAGALCVAGLLAGRSPEQLSRLLDAHGPKIFPGTGLWRRLRWIVTSKYAPAPLHAALDEVLGGWNPRLGDLDHKVVFPALDETEGRAILFTNANPAHHDVRLRDAALASAAAPSYFPAHRIEALGRRYVDGGLFANAPDLAALTVARRLWPELLLSDIHILSIGTTRNDAGSPYGEDHPGARGLASWMLRPPARMLKLAMSSQVDHAVALLPELRLADFIRLDADLDGAGQRIELDTATPDALRTLTDNGAAAVSSLPRTSARG